MASKNYIEKYGKPDTPTDLKKQNKVSAPDDYLIFANQCKLDDEDMG